MQPDSDNVRRGGWALLREGLMLPLELYLRPDSFRRRVHALAPDLPDDFSLWQARRRWRDRHFRHELYRLALLSMIALIWALPIAYGFQLAGFAVSWPTVAFGVAFGVAVGVAGGVAWGVAGGVA
ncbi:MAG: hypothetical protein WCJ55_20195, partial [Chloroflexales bacterium]